MQHDDTQNSPSDGSPQGKPNALLTIFAVILSTMFSGLGQAYNGQWLKGLAFAVASFVLWFVLLGWVPMCWSIADAGIVCWRKTGRDREGSFYSSMRTALFACFVVAELGLTLWYYWHAPSL